MSQFPKPYTIEDTTAWLKKANQAWQFLSPVDLHGSVDPPVVEKPVETYKQGWGCLFIMIAVLVGLFLLGGIFILGWGL